MISFELPHLYLKDYVYALLCETDGGEGFVKFGRSSNVTARLSQLRSACPIPAKYFAVVQTPSERTCKDLELGFHRHFRERRIKGEWFKFDFRSQEDKEAFNQGSRLLFLAHLPAGIWWTKISVEAIDQYIQERRRAFLNSKHRGKLMRSAKYREKVRKAHRELASYGIK